jgi:Zn-dependent peptidase ImmA (M78 family)
MTIQYSPSDLESVFGAGSSGNTPEERAKTSKTSFVRSQLQLAFDSPDAKGRKLSAQEALRVFGWEILRTVGREESAPLLQSSKEPSRTLKRRRIELGLGADVVSKKAAVSQEQLLLAETPGHVSSIRVLEAVGQAIALDERRLGFQPNAGADNELGVRLREMSVQGDAGGFSQSTVLQLTEAAWVVSRQHELQMQLGIQNADSVLLPEHDSRYSYPTYEIGYQLARRTRAILRLDDSQPIESVREVVERRFGIPLIQEQINQQFAGATIANGEARGIVVNEQGLNRNVWVRRMTLCHELGHLLWDPDESLDRLRVDDYDHLEQNERIVKRDPAEIRANAFAIAFLAPPTAVDRITRQSSSAQQAVVEVMKHFGISATAARYHVGNVSNQSIPLDWHATQIEPDQKWIVSENLTVDFFPIQQTPISRRGMFAWYVAKLCDEGAISVDTAAMYLKTQAEGLKSRLDRVLELFQ